MARRDTHPMQLDALPPVVRRAALNDRTHQAAPWSDTLPTSVVSRSARLAQERRDRLWGSGIPVGLAALLVLAARRILRR
jgi:hypothetical protein